MRLLRGNISLLNPVKFLKLMTLSRLLSADQFFVAIKQAFYYQRKYFCLVLGGWDYSEGQAGNLISLVFSTCTFNSKT